MEWPECYLEVLHLGRQCAPGCGSLPPLSPPRCRSVVSSVAPFGGVIETLVVVVTTNTRWLRTIDGRVGLANFGGCELALPACLPPMPRRRLFVYVCMCLNFAHSRSSTNLAVVVVDVCVRCHGHHHHHQHRQPMIVKSSSRKKSCTRKHTHTCEPKAIAEGDVDKCLHLPKVSLTCRVL